MLIFCLIFAVQQLAKKLVADFAQISCGRFKRVYQCWLELINLKIWRINSRTELSAITKCKKPRARSWLAGCLLNKSIKSAFTFSSTTIALVFCFSAELGAKMWLALPKHLSVYIQGLANLQPSCDRMWRQRFWRNKERRMRSPTSSASRPSLLGSEAPLVSSRSRFQFFLESLSLLLTSSLSHWSLLLCCPSYECLWRLLLLLVAPLGPRGVASR